MASATNERRSSFRWRGGNCEAPCQQQVTAVCFWEFQARLCCSTAYRWIQAKVSAVLLNYFPPPDLPVFIFLTALQFTISPGWCEPLPPAVQRPKWSRTKSRKL